MKQQTTFITTKIARILSCFLILLLGGGTFYGQTKQYATGPVTGDVDQVGLIGKGAANIVGVPNANNDLNTFATLTSARGLAGIAGSGDAWLKLTFPSDLAAKDWVYIRYSDIASTGINLDLLGLLGNPAEFLDVKLYKGAVVNNSSVIYKVLVNEKGETLIGVQAPTNTVAFNSVRIKLTFGSAVSVAATRSMRIYYAYTLSGVTVCDPISIASAGEATGISVDLGGLLGAGRNVVENPSNAIDANTSNYATLSGGLLSVAGTFSQSFYFSAASESNSNLKVRLQLSAAVANVNLLGGYFIKAYNGTSTTPVFTQNLQGGLIGGLDVLGLLNTGGVATLNLAIPGVYDRVEIGLNGVVGVNVGSDLRIYEVSRTSESCPPPPPTPNPLFDPVCANTTIVSSSNADDPQNAVDGDFDSYATVRSDDGILIGLGSRAGHLEAKFDAPVPAGKTTYVRIDFEESVLKSLLGGSIGGILSGLVDGLVLGNHYFEIQLKNGSTETLNTSSSNLFSSSNGQVKLVQDKEGRYYVAIKALDSFTNIRITDKTTAVVGLLSPEKYLKIYSICFDNSDDVCNQAFSTSFEGSGLTLDLLKAGGFGVTNPQYAIDDNDATASEISTGLLSVAGSMSQYIHYNSVSDPEGVFKIKMALAASTTLDVDLLGAYEVLAYNGETQVYRRSLGGGLLNGTDVLGLLGGGVPGWLTFAPGKAFDRIEIRVNGLVGVGLDRTAVKVYDVKRFGNATSLCKDPDFELPLPSEDPFENCEATVIDWDNADYPWLAADGNNESYATLTASSGALLGGLLGAKPYSGFLEYEFPTAVAAGKTTYIRIDMDENILKGLLGGTLGELAGNLVSDLIGNHYFEVEAKTNATSAAFFKGSSKNRFFGTQGGDLRLVQDNIGRSYIAITPNQSYKNIRISEHLVAILAGVTDSDVVSMKVFEACFEIKDEACLDAQFTSYDMSGLTLSVGNVLNGAGVENAYRAISGIGSDYSEISTGTVSVLGGVTQSIYFDKLSTPNDTLKVRMQMNQPSLLEVELLGNYKVVTYNNNVVAQTFYLKDGLNLISDLNVLNLFKSGGVQTIYFETTQLFDRVDIIVGDLLNIALTPSLRLYEVKRFGTECPESKEETPFHMPYCATKLVDASNADDLQNLFDDDFGSYAILNSGAGTLLGINQLQGFVELGYNDIIPAGTTSYIRIDFEGSLLSKLVSGSLGNVVSGLLDGLVLGDHYFNIEVKNNTYDTDGNVTNSAAVPVDAASSKEANAGGNNSIRVVQDYKGRYYIAVTPTGDYNAVRITDITENFLGVTAQPNTMNVYGMCYETSTDCEKAFMATSYDYSGLALTVPDLSGAGVTNGHYAIDENSTSASEISMGTLNLFGSTKQWIFLNREMSASEAVRIDLQMGTGTVDINVLGNLQIKAYLGDTEVHTLAWGSGLVNGIDVLDLLNNNARIELPYRPGVPYDRISVGMETGLVSASVFPPIELFGVIRCYDMTHLGKSCVISNPMLTNKIKK